MRVDNFCEVKILNYLSTPILPSALFASTCSTYMNIKAKRKSDAFKYLLHLCQRQGLRLIFGTTALTFKVNHHRHHRHDFLTSHHTASHRRYHHRIHTTKQANSPLPRASSAGQRTAACEDSLYWYRSSRAITAETLRPDHIR